MKWEKTGGGCHTCAGGADEMMYPCDDSYENTETGERITIYSTQERHFEMPNEVDAIAELYALDGVKPEWAVDAEGWKHG